MGDLGAVLGGLGAVLEWSLAVSGGLGAILGGLGASESDLGMVLGYSWEIVGMVWGCSAPGMILGWSWDDLGEYLDLRISREGLKRRLGKSWRGSWEGPGI